MGRILKAILDPAGLVQGQKDAKKAAEAQANAIRDSSRRAAASANFAAEAAAQVPTDVYYKNCSAARAAGAAPVLAGQPGYGKHLDRDGDGIGCE